MPARDGSATVATRRPGRPRRTIATFGAALTLATGTLLGAGDSVRSADWAARFSKAPDAVRARDDRANSRLDAAASALMAQSLAFQASERPIEPDVPIGVRIVPATLIDRDRRSSDRLPAESRRPATVPEARLTAPPAATAERAKPQSAATAPTAPPRVRAPARRPADVPLPPRRPVIGASADTLATASAQEAPHTGTLTAPEPTVSAEVGAETAAGTTPTAAAPTIAHAGADVGPVAAPVGGGAHLVINAHEAAGASNPDAPPSRSAEPPAATAVASPSVPATLRGETAVDAPLASVSDRAGGAASADRPQPVSAPTAQAAALRPVRALLPEVVGIGPALAEDPPPPPPPVASQSDIVRLVRALSSLQDDMARGSGAALTAQGVLMRSISEVFLGADPRLWSEAHNARSLILYALSGGNPQVVRAVAAMGTLNPSFEPLAAGALAYLEGRAEDARRHFGAVDPTTLDPSLSGPFFLAHAALRVDGDTTAARRDLDAARFAAPGSLVEEAALRRAILIAAETDDVDGFARLVNRYLRRFRESVYAGNFRRRLAAAVTRMSFIREPGAFDRLDTILAPMTPAGRQELYLLVSRAAVENGSRRAAALAAEKAAATAAEGTLDATRARLYRAAALVVDPEETDGALETLRALGVEPLPADDAALLTAAIELGVAVTDLPAVPTDEPAPPADGDSTSVDAAPGDPGNDDRNAPDGDIVAAVETRATALLDAVDLLLAESGDQP